jgi:glycosyltransferase 2 family protein
LLGPLFGLPAEAALALSLLKRGRDIAIGIPVLLIWQFLEGRQTRARA